MSQDREKKIVFGIGKGADGTPVLILGISKAAFEYAAGDLCHDFDLTKIGVDVKLLVFTRETHDGARKHLDEIMAAAGVPVLDETRRDFGIKRPC